MVKNPPASVGNMGSIPGLEDPTCLGATEPECLELVPHNKKSHCSEEPMHHKWRVAATHCNCRKPMHSNEGPAQPKYMQTCMKKKRSGLKWLYPL